MVKGKYSNFEMEKELIVQNENPWTKINLSDYIKF